MFALMFKNDQNIKAIYKANRKAYIAKVYLYLKINVLYIPYILNSYQFYFMHSAVRRIECDANVTVELRHCRNMRNER